MRALGARDMLGAVLLVDDLEVFSTSNGSMIPWTTLRIFSNLSDPMILQT